MKLAISNLAWNADENETIIPILQKLRIRGVELAPTKNWPALETVSEEQAVSVRKYWEQQGFSICALQSLLFGRGDLVLFRMIPLEQNHWSSLKRCWIFPAGSELMLLFLDLRKIDFAAP